MVAKSEYKNGHVICTETFPLTSTNQIEIHIKSGKKLYEIDFFAKSNHRLICKYFTKKIFIHSFKFIFFMLFRLTVSEKNGCNLQSINHVIDLSNFTNLIRNSSIIEIGPKHNLNENFSILSKDNRIENSKLKLCKNLLNCREIFDNCDFYYFICPVFFDTIQIHQISVRSYFNVNFYF